MRLRGVIESSSPSSAKPHRYHVERLGRHHDRADSHAARIPSTPTSDRERGKTTTVTSPLFSYSTMAKTPDRRVLHPQRLGRPPPGSTTGNTATLPRYPIVPVILLGRLAIDREYQDQHLGDALLFDALRRAFTVGTQEIGAMAVIVDALHDRARMFYERYGFQRFPDNEISSSYQCGRLHTSSRMMTPRPG